ncbi:MAG: hypothetical protein EOP40_13510 [Rubrivivax sp.]|nr:MAG: hypothetical protein EOP40_13510 [Rubrivivax sp.]
MPLWRLLAAAAAFMAYALLSWSLMTWRPNSPWAVVMLLGPVIVPLLVAGVVKRHRLSLAGGLLAMALLAALLYTGNTAMNRLYLLQHASVHALLGWGFAVTLRPGATPLITMMAERIHSEFTPAMRAYTRWLTGLWVLYFVAMIGVSFALYLFAPWPWWAFFCNVLTPLAAVLFFAVEHVLRYRRHPEFERVSLGQVVRAWRASER